MRLGARSVAISALLLCSLLLASCLSATERDFLLYDPATDEFRSLMILSDIRSKDSDDLDYLARIDANRDHWLGPTLITTGLASGELLRFSNSTFAALDFFSSPSTSLNIQKTSVPLDTIAITPGTLFIENKKLCYYQAIRVPGKTVDAALEELGQSFQEGFKDNITKEIQDELDRRAAGGKTLSWDEFTRMGLREMDGSIKPPTTAPVTQPATQAAAPAAVATTTPTTAPGEPSETPEYVLSVASLNHLKDAVIARKLRITRARQVLSLTLPLDPADTTAAMKTATAVVTHARELLRGHETDNSDAYIAIRQLLAFDSSTKLAASPEGLVISLDLLAYSRSFTSIRTARTDENSTPAKQPAETQPAQPPPPPPDPIAYVRDHHLPVDEHITADQIIADFHAGNLASHPAIPPVAPGDGFSISEIQPATAP